jgi:hypothetical protein
VGATIASSRCLAIVVSMPSMRANFRFFASDLRYAASVSGPFFCASTSRSCAKYGISRAALRSL